VLVVVHTRSRIGELRRSLTSVATWLRPDAVVIVDDSPRNEERSVNAELARALPFRKVAHIDAATGPALVEEIAARTAIGAASIEHMTGKLGDSGWNTPACRNMALLCAAMERDQPIMLLDDDICFDGTVSLKLQHRNTLASLSFRGRPDLDDAGWVVLAAHALTSRHDALGACEGRVTTIATSTSAPDLLHLVSSATDLLDDQVIERSARSWPVPSCSGAAVTLWKRGKLLPLVPPGRDEDVQWIRLCRAQGWLVRRMSAPAVHEPERRRELTALTLVASELGAAVSSLSRLKVSGWTGRLEQALGVFLQRRAASLIDLRLTLVDHDSLGAARLAQLLDDAANQLTNIAEVDKQFACSKAQAYADRTKAWARLQNVLLERSVTNSALWELG
jgi:hypothetical protein